jgi:hypothetical protein
MISNTLWRVSGMDTIQYLSQTYKAILKIIGLKLRRLKMQIEVKTEDCVYITINGFVYYIDDSTDEQIMQKWKTHYREVEDVNKQSD